jgi:hypothetical protein
MIEVKYGEHFEVADIAGNTIHEAREKFKAEFEIPGKARAKLNGKTIKSGLEEKVVLNDDDNLTFAVVRSRVPFLVGAVLLALAVTGGVFAYGFINATTTLMASVYESNFADVSVNTTGVNAMNAIGWKAWGYYKGSIPGGYDIFNVVPGDNYTGDLAVTVALGNADALVKIYRMLSLQLQMVYSDNTSEVVDINESSDNGTGDAEDWVVLSLDNGSVTMFPQGTSGARAMSVRIKRGFYITQIHPYYPPGWPSDASASPELFCEVAQR